MCCLLQALSLKQEAENEMAAKIRKLQAEKQSLQASIEMLRKQLAALEAERLRARSKPADKDKNATRVCKLKKGKR